MVCVYDCVIMNPTTMLNCNASIKKESTQAWLNVGVPDSEFAMTPEGHDEFVGGSKGGGDGWTDRQTESQTLSDWSKNL